MCTQESWALLNGGWWGVVGGVAGRVCLSVGLKTAGQQEVVGPFEDLSQTPLSLSLFAALSFHKRL